MKNPEVRVQGIVFSAGKILVALHARRRETYWVLPGGHREAGETLAEALARELDEEAGIRAVDMAFFSISEVLLGHREILDVVFRVDAYEGEPRVGAPPVTAGDRRLASLELHDLASFRELTFRPAALALPIIAAWEREDWTPVGYLGNLAVGSR